jgi:predicted HTH domain antitoxin
MSKFQDMLKEQRMNPETSRSGLKWESYEDELLVEKVKEGVDKGEIAKLLSRTEGSIKTRLIIYAVNKVEQEKLSVEEASKLYDVSDKDVELYITKKQYRGEKKYTKVQTPKYDNNRDVYSMLNTINSKLDLLLSR